MAYRVAIVFLIGLIVGLCLGIAMFLTLEPGAWTISKALMLISCLSAAPWVGFCAANGVIGFLLQLSRPAVPPVQSLKGPFPRTVVVVPVRDEDMVQVLSSIGCMLDGLDAADVGEAFTVFILSDTCDADFIEREEKSFAAFQSGIQQAHRLHYRRRVTNTGLKAGNVMDFLDHHGDEFDLMLVLDADSKMTPAAVVRLIMAMRDNPVLGIVQHLTVGLPAALPLPRIFQFGMRAGMRTWASGLVWWQGDACVYWGHNALVRIAPFREHCRLPLLPNGGHILSHDQIEAAILCGAGWGVRLLDQEDGSYELNPPALPEFLRRELRWLAGNFEYCYFLGMPGLRPMGRWQLIQAILLFAFTPFYLIFLIAAAWAAATDHESPFPFYPALAATLIWTFGLYAPKLLGYLELLLSREKRVRYGGYRRLITSSALEIIFSLLLDSINMPAKTFAIIRAVTKSKPRWSAQNRVARGVSWSESALLLWPQTLIGLVALGCFVRASCTAAVWAAPFIFGMVVSIPFCVSTASPAFGAWLTTRDIASVPEELNPMS